MPAVVAQSFVDLYTALPVIKQKQLEATTEAYMRALDEAIANVLGPTVGRTDSQFIVQDDIIPLYGVGATPAEAEADYRSVVVEWYESLQADEAELAPHLREQLELLRRVFTLAEKVS